MLIFEQLYIPCRPRSGTSLGFLSSRGSSLCDPKNLSLISDSRISECTAITLALLSNPTKLFNMRRRGRKDTRSAPVAASACSVPDTAVDAAATTEINSESDSSHACKTGWSPNETENVRAHPASHGSAKGKKRRHTLVFFLGSLFGLVAAGLFAKSNDLIDFPEIGELTMDSFFDVLPAGLVSDMRELVVRRNTLFFHQALCTASTICKQYADGIVLPCV